MKISKVLIALSSGSQLIPKSNVGKMKHGKVDTQLGKINFDFKNAQKLTTNKFSLDDSINNKYDFLKSHLYENSFVQEEFTPIEIQKKNSDVLRDELLKLIESQAKKPSKENLNKMTLLYETISLIDKHEGTLIEEFVHTHKKEMNKTMKFEKMLESISTKLTKKFTDDLESKFQKTVKEITKNHEIPTSDKKAILSDMKKEVDKLNSNFDLSLPDHVKNELMNIYLSRTTVVTLKDKMISLESELASLDSKHKDFPNKAKEIKDELASVKEEYDRAANDLDINLEKFYGEIKPIKTKTTSSEDKKTEQEDKSNFEKILKRGRDLKDPKAQKSFPLWLQAVLIALTVELIRRQTFEQLSKSTVVEKTKGLIGGIAQEIQTTFSYYLKTPQDEYKEFLDSFMNNKFEIENIVDKIKELPINDSHQHLIAQREEEVSKLLVAAYNLIENINSFQVDLPSPKEINKDNWKEVQSNIVSKRNELNEKLDLINTELNDLKNGYQARDLLKEKLEAYDSKIMNLSKSINGTYPNHVPTFLEKTKAKINKEKLRDSEEKLDDNIKLQKNLDVIKQDCDKLDTIKRIHENVIGHYNRAVKLLDNIKKKSLIEEDINSFNNLSSNIKSKYNDYMNTDTKSDKDLSALKNCLYSIEELEKEVKNFSKKASVEKAPVKKGIFGY